ncbi:TrkA-N domain-containing protein [Candidatus Protofrankia californiensis]|uniref:TrkA-N domain-containing protein n=1 Tax=Candidatus Protofrankia californiensis TaxID=1839754 RepID=A0A1C3P4J7_9ACTN|nr:TrkA-N domain-containing protein [Candidatus Protofrankia californiensis]
MMLEGGGFLRTTNAALTSEPAARRKVEGYFRAVRAAFPEEPRVGTIVITHLLPDRPYFLDALAGLSDLRAVLPKPRSYDPFTRESVSTRYRCDDLDRMRFSDSTVLLEYIESRAAGMDLALLDVGGYFAPALNDLCRLFSGRILGVVEDTENGYQKYLAIEKIPCPVFSVARSPLKLPEDYLVGQSVVFSIESLLRSHGGILHGGETCVIGYGKVGRSVANTLRAKSVRTTVLETDPVRAVEALSHGFAVSSTKEQALARADIVVCATGRRALVGDDFTRLRRGAYLASVTSSDDELDFRAVQRSYRQQQLGPHVTRLSTDRHHFYLLNDGNAVNFIHGAAVGSFIYLIQGEILAAAALLASRRGVEPGLQQVGPQPREIIARSWLHSFNGE